MPSMRQGILVLAGLYNAQGCFDDGLQATRKAVSAGAARWDVEYEIARGLISKGQYQPALVATEDGLRLK